MKTGTPLAEAEDMSPSAQHLSLSWTGKGTDDERIWSRPRSVERVADVCRFGSWARRSLRLKKRIRDPNQQETKPPELRSEG